MNSSEVKCFLAAANYMSFSQAANELFLSRQAVSRQIIHLEQELQTRLFVRGNQSLMLTETGQQYYEFFSSVEKQWNGLQAQLQGKRASGTISVAYLEGLNITQSLLDNVFSLGAQHHVQIDLHTYDMHNLPDLVQSETQDFILTYQGPRLDMFTGYTNVPVETVGMVLVVANSLRQGTDLTAYEKYPVVTWSRRNQSTEQAVQNCIRHCLDFGFSCHDVHVSPNRDTARLEIENGHCIGICTAIDRMAYSPAVFTLPLHGSSVIACMWRTNNRSPVVQQIARELRKNAQQQIAPADALPLSER